MARRAEPHGLMPGRQDARVGRLRQHRPGDVSARPLAGVRALPRLRPLHQAGGGRAAGRRARQHRGRLPRQRLRHGEQPAQQPHAPLGERRIAADDEADGLLHQHRPRPARRRAGADRSPARRVDRGRRPRRVRARAHRARQSAARDGQRTDLAAWPGLDRGDRRQQRDRGLRKHPRRVPRRGAPGLVNREVLERPGFQAKLARYREKQG